MTALVANPSGHGHAARSTVVWPEDDSLRLVCLLQARGAAPLLATSKSMQHLYSDFVDMQRRAESDPAKSLPSLDVLHVSASLEHAFAEASERLSIPSGGGLGAAPMSLQTSLTRLSHLEGLLHTEMQYIYAHDWELKPGRLISRKGTWMKSSTKFSWEIHEDDKHYIPHGVALPALQIGRVTDQVELQRHDWSGQHLRVWLNPVILQTLRDRHNTWFIYYPHWEVKGNVITAAADTWLKRSCQMSGEMQPFELIYVPQGVPVQLKRPPEFVDEPWEQSRHQHVNQHRKIILPSLPMTARQDKIDIFCGQEQA